MMCDHNFFSDRKKITWNHNIYRVCVVHVMILIVSIRKTDGTINQYYLAEITGGRARLRGRQLRTYGRFEKPTRIKDVHKRPTRLSLSSTELPVDHRYT